MKVSLVEQMRELDRRASDEFGISDALLMENAGLAAYDVLSANTPVDGKRFLVVCGVGNNGGDGLVVARKLVSNGAKVTVFIVGDPVRFAGAARDNYEIVKRLPIDARRVDDAVEIQEAAERAVAVVDAVFGTGISREVTGLYREVIEAINASKRPVISLDIPSGVNGDTGLVMGVAVEAEHTVTFGLPKVGNVLPPGADHCGELHVSYISFPPELQNAAELDISLDAPSALPRRTRETLDSGEALFVSGSYDAMGAPYFAASAFLRSGGNSAALAGPKSASSVIAQRVPQVEWLPQRETRAGGVARANLDELVAAAQRFRMVTLGGGLVSDGEGKELVRELLTRVDRPILLDGANSAAFDAGEFSIPSPATTCWVVSPSELGVLAGQHAADIAADRVGAVRRAASARGMHVVLQGLHSLVAHPDGSVYINTSGNPGMITAGSGSAQLGAIAAMLAVGLPFGEACQTGVFLHGLASDMAANEVGVDGMTAQDILDQLPPAVRMLRDGLSAERKAKYAGARVV